MKATFNKQTKLEKEDTKINLQLELVKNECRN